MTDRFHSLIVVMEHDWTDDDVQILIAAIGMLRGVLSVTGGVASIESHVAEERARFELGQKLLKIVYPNRET